MAAALIVPPFYSDGSFVGFVIGIVMSIFVFVILVVAHPHCLLLCRCHHYVT